jgi:hypothetical protein
MSFLTYVFGKGYTGGPNFSTLETFRFDLEGIKLSLSLPKSNFPVPRDEMNINLPFRSSGWFDTHCEQMWNHFYVMLVGRPWAYIGPFWKTAADRTFGVLDVQAAIKRAPADKVLDPDDLDTLAEAIRWDYEWYFEVAEPGKYGQGGNRTTRQEAEDEYNAHPRLREEIRQRQKAGLLKYLRELPTHFETRCYGDQNWLYYALEKEPAYPAHYYCQPLDERYYLYIRFGYGIDLRPYFHLWQADAEAAEQRIIETVRLDFPNRLPTPDPVPMLIGKSEDPRG